MNNKESCYSQPQKAKWLALPIWDHEVPGSNLARGGTQLMADWHFIATSLSLSPLHHLNINWLMLKGT